MVSPQVLAEFFVTLTRKQLWTVVESTGLLVLEAARAVRKYRLDFWDAQIWAAARLNMVPLVLSEDFAEDAVLEGVRFVNPFATDFRLERWLWGIPLSPRQWLKINY